jgi:hypothetical protein
MKKFWIKYGLCVQITVLIAALVLMLFYKFWEEVPEKRWLRWLQFSIFLFYLIDRIVKLINRNKAAEA